MKEILIYYIWMALSLYVVYVLFCRTFVKQRGGEFKKKTYPIFMPALGVLFSIIPVGNIIFFVSAVIYMYALHEEDSAEFRTFLFKKV